MTQTDELIHIWYHCDHCKSAPIIGRRYHCMSCPDGPDNDLCETCYTAFQNGKAVHPGSSPFAKPGGEHHFVTSEGEPKSQFAAWLEIPFAIAPAPPVPDRFLVRPEFCSGYESTFGGFGFTVFWEGSAHPLVLTALHVMDEMIKKKKINCHVENPAYTGRELPAVVSKLNMYDVLAPNWMISDLGFCSKMLALPDARLGEPEPYSWRDLTAFVATNGKNLNPGRLAAAPPAVGDPIWVAAGPEGDWTGRTYEAVVVEQTEKTLIYKFRGPAKPPKYHSGSPLLDRNGEVVGLVVGAGNMDGYRFGHGCHVGAMRRILAAAL